MPVQTWKEKVNMSDFFPVQNPKIKSYNTLYKNVWNIRKQRNLLPVSNSHVTLVFEGNFLGVDLIAGVAVSLPTLGDEQHKDLYIQI